MMVPWGVTRNCPRVGALLLDWLDRLVIELVDELTRELDELDNGTDEGVDELDRVTT